MASSNKRFGSRSKISWNYYEIFRDFWGSWLLNVDTSLIKRRLLFVNKIYSEEQIDDEQEGITPKLEIVENKLEMNHSVEQFGKIGLEIGTLNEDDASEDEKLIPEVSETYCKAMNRKAGIIASSRSNIDSSKIGKKPISRDRCILSRQIIKELLFLKPKNEQDLIKSITIKFLIDTYGDDTQEQILEYSDEILDILKDKKLTCKLD